MIFTRLVTLLILLTLAPLFVFSQSNTKVAVIAYYNLENLFDTIDSPNTNDAEFLPNGKNLWNTEKYYKKLSNMSKVISEIGEEYIKGGPTIIGVSEVENRAVLE
ncbi:MAG: endonuclease/exonuclease/phosphatase family protein, partial [Lentimicrobiaceae bacterium]|nr:endonuclease/exonuclease/phosphatase family protein [Lentimicrobiaceae bacterium]